MNSNQSKFISELVNEKCADRMIRFTFDHCKEHTLHHMPRPYKNVKSFSFCGNLHYIPLNVLFSKIQSLFFHFISTLNGRYINCDLPHLTHLFVDISDYESLKIS